MVSLTEQKYLMKSISFIFERDYFENTWLVGESGISTDTIFEINNKTGLKQALVRERERENGGSIY